MLKDIEPTLLACLNSPALFLSISNLNKEKVMACARSCKLLAHLGYKLNQAGLLAQLPEKIQDNFHAIQTLIEYRNQTLTWELNRLERALVGSSHDVVVLKGGAYLLLGLPGARNRAVADVDIMVRYDELDNIEEVLKKQGWISANLDEYDQHYYRTWMHEIPPLRHRQRNIEVDIHHAILPVTCRLQPNSNAMMEDSVNIKESFFNVLSPEDMFLHSVSHLFYNSELKVFDFRDLVDQDALISYFLAKDCEFWEKLAKRAKLHNLERPLYYSLKYAKKYLNTPVPDNIFKGISQKPSYIIDKLMDVLVALSLIPNSTSSNGLKRKLARFLLYIRSHWLKMPLNLLLPHLLRKSFMRLSVKV